MTITLNDKKLELKDGITCEEAILQAAKLQEGFVVAINNTVIPRKNWASTILKDGDKIVLVKLACGG